jgi:dipeptidase D
MFSEVNAAVLDRLLTRKDSKAPVIRDFWKFLMICFQTPRPSTNYDGVVNEARGIPFQNAMRGVCADHGLRYLMDQVGNIIIKNFLEDGPKARFCFQGHSDVVVSKNESAVHNFETDGVDIQITTDGTVKPVKGTTLGADNGVAIACGLAILVNNKNVPLELLITKNEETSFDGACGLDASLISANTILNLDSEVEKAICVGSAGGFEQRFYLPIEPDNACTLLQFRVSLKDLKGGHSGIDIENEKSNAIMELIRILFDRNIRIMDIKGGTSTNAIPREASAVIACPEDALAGIYKSFQDLQSEVVINEPSMRLVVEKFESKGKLIPTSEGFSQRLKALILSVGTGVVRKLKGNVECSFNLGLVSTETNRVSIRYLVRSTSVSWMQFFAKQLTMTGEMYEAEVEAFLGFFGAWEPQYDSRILQDLLKHHPDATANVKTYTVHAGLECSTILERFTDIGRTNVECASIGPQIEHAHSPDECLYIESAVEFVHWVNNLVKGA